MLTCVNMCGRRLRFGRGVWVVHPLFIYREHNKLRKLLLHSLMRIIWRPAFHQQLSNVGNCCYWDIRTEFSVSDTGFDPPPWAIIWVMAPSPIRSRMFLSPNKADYFSYLWLNYLKHFFLLNTTNYVLKNSNSLWLTHFIFSNSNQT